MSTVPRSRSTDKRYYGVVEGLVTDNIDPDQEGKVKVQFPWFDDNMVSEWCRVMQPYAGPGYGMFFVPEVGDEVVVAFGHGDMRLPIIMGGVYNGQDKPPTHRDASTDLKLIQTKAGHQLLFNDSADSHQVKITTKGGHEVDLNDQNQSITIKSTGGQTISLDDQDGSITISTSGGQSVTLSASGATISATSVTIAGTASINLGQAAGSSLILGEPFLTYFNLHTHNCTAPGTPSGFPVPPMTPALFSTISKTS